MSLSNQTSKLDAQANISLTPEESFAGIMLAAVAVDGFMAEEELQNCLTSLKRTKLFKSHSKEYVLETLKKLIKIVKEHNADILLELSLPNLPEYLYETVFAIATDITLSDGALFDEELQMLSKLSKSLSIPEATVDEIIKVMMIKNKG